MSDPIETLRAINGRQADTADADLLALLTEDDTSRIVGSSDHVLIDGYTDLGGGKHCTETTLPSRLRSRT